jgi:hypothetical protein
MRGRVLLWPVLACTAIALAGCGESKQAAADREKIAALTARLDSLQTDVARAKDVSAIKKLQRTYGYYLDRGLADDMADLFTDNDPVAEYESGAFIGKDSIRRAFRFLGPANSLPEGRMMTHMQLQGVVHVAEDGKTAKGRWRALAMTANAGQANWQEGPYEVQYVKEDDVWKIKDLHWYQTFTAPYEGGWAKHSSVRPPPAAAKPGTATRPVPDRAGQAKTWPDSVVPPYHYKNPVTGQ